VHISGLNLVHSMVCTPEKKGGFSCKFGSVRKDRRQNLYQPYAVLGRSGAGETELGGNCQFDCRAEQNRCGEQGELQTLRRL
jgi:hypothetical protein